MLESDPTLEIVQAMMKGQRPTAPTFACPACGGLARLHANPVGLKWLQVSVRCDCGEAMEMDGGGWWDGCEVLFSPAAKAYVERLRKNLEISD